MLDDPVELLDEMLDKVSRTALCESAGSQTITKLLCTARALIDAAEQKSNICYCKDTSSTRNKSDKVSD